MFLFVVIVLSSDFRLTRLCALGAHKLRPSLLARPTLFSHSCKRASRHARTPALASTLTHAPPQPRTLTPLLSYLGQVQAASAVAQALCQYIDVVEGQVNLRAMRACAGLDWVHAARVSCARAPSSCPRLVSPRRA